MTKARILVRPHPSYVSGTADPYHFLYRIEIENLGPGTVQLLLDWCRCQFASAK